jgi:hypothetical protein
VDLASYVGQSIRIKFLMQQNGFGALTGIFVVDVQFNVAVRARCSVRILFIKAGL